MCGIYLSVEQEIELIDVLERELNNAPAGVTDRVMSHADLRKLIAAVRNERERCAKVCDAAAAKALRKQKGCGYQGNCYGEAIEGMAIDTAKQNAAAIRALGDPQ